MEGACAIRDSFLSSIPGKHAAQYDLTIAIEPGLLFELMEVSRTPSATLNGFMYACADSALICMHFIPQSLQEEPTSTSSQLVELMMAARVNLTSELPRDLPPDALLSHGSFLINLEGEELQC